MVDDATEAIAETRSAARQLVIPPRPRHMIKGRGARIKPASRTAQPAPPERSTVAAIPPR